MSAARKLTKVVHLHPGRAKPRLTAAGTYCLPLAELPCAEYSRHQAQRLRADMIRDGVTWPSTYVSRVVLPDGTPVWRVAMPL